MNEYWVWGFEYSAGGAGGETELASGAVVDDPASSAAAVSEGDQISIAPREEITEMEVAAEVSEFQYLTNPLSIRFFWAQKAWELASRA